MIKRRQIKAGAGARRLRSALSGALDRALALAYAIEERFLWRGADLLRGAGEAVRWPFERAAWPIERRLLWPLQERAAGWGVSGRAAGAGALAAVAAVAAVIGALALSGSGENAAEPAATPRVAVLTEAERAPVERQRGPVLRGVAPSFALAESSGVAAPKASGEGAAEESAAAAAGAEGEDAAATTSKSEKAVPAGPAAMKVARRFAEAFVFYEIGERRARAETVFGETATPRLAAALGERPPRQPARVEVPQARVLNLVPGPRHGKAYTLSASLLRVGTTSELRLEVKKVKGSWVVTDVRG